MEIIRAPANSSAMVEQDLRYVDWPAILAGAFLAMGLTVVLLSFGAAFGLSMTSALPGEGVSLRWITIAGGIWLLWTAVTSFAAGGYLTGRLRRRLGDANADEVEARDGAHGVVVWAVGAVLGGFLAASGVTGTMGAASSGALSAIEAADVQLSDTTTYASSVLLRGEATQGSDAAKAEVAAILSRGFMAGEVADADRQYLKSFVVAQTNLTPAVADSRVDQAIADGLAARAATLKAVDQARFATMIAAFVLAASMLVSAAAAYFAATVGGTHRDSNLGFRTYGR